MDISKREKVLKSVFESTTFGADIAIYINRTVGSASISPSGRDVVLASTDGLDIIDLESPSSPPRHLRNGSPWLVADVQWSPFAARDYWVVSTANQKILVWNLNKQEDNNGCVEHTLTAHQRAITDINFSAHHPDILATCAVDGHVHLWDLRRPKKPAITFTDWFGGATQVKCNRQDSHIYASSHDQWLRIWDDRKNAAPLRSINAHVSKIYGVDWNRTRGTSVVTCSLDKTIKFWDYSNETDEEELIIRTEFPVWRARHTPFGYGLLAMPQDAPGNLHLYGIRKVDGANKDISKQSVKIFSSPGHFKVKEFLWRSRGGIMENGMDNRDFQLISWGEDNILRLQKVEPSVLKNVGYIKGTQFYNKLNITRMGAVYKTFRVTENPVTKGKSPNITIAPKPTSSSFKMNAQKTEITKKSVYNPIKSNAKSEVVPGLLVKTTQTSSREKKEQDATDLMRRNKTDTVMYDSSQNKVPREISLLYPDLNRKREWDQLGILHDEIIRIHYQLPMIVFDDLDMERRMIVTSINVPWIDNSSYDFIKLRILFPKCYPEIESPTFNIENTSSFPSSILAKLSSDIQQIASSFTARGLCCLETVFRYLLGELDYETSIPVNQTRIMDGDFTTDDESYSDEGNFPAGASTDTIPPVRHNANVPLPRLCGAAFSTNGRLVCFFLPAKDKVKSLLATLITSHDTRSKDKPYFESFGRLKNNRLLSGEKKLHLLTSFESPSDSEDMDELETSNSSDSDFSVPCDESLFLRYIGNYSRHPFQRGNTSLDTQKPIGARTNTGTGTCMENWVPEPKSVITIYSVQDILPSKTELAREYIVSGDCFEVCRHNSAVAEKHGFREIADVWNYIEIILCGIASLRDLTAKQKQINPEGMKQYFNHIKYSCVSTYSVWPCSFLDRMRWGTHPLMGHLVRDLFLYFEQQADIQMLAMLSCVFSDATILELINSKPSIDQHHSPLPLKMPVSLNSYSSGILIENTSGKMPTKANNMTRKHHEASLGNNQTTGSARVDWAISPKRVAQSFAGAPPAISGWTSTRQKSRKSQSLSASPEGLKRGFRRVNSLGLASTFAASIYRFASSSSSPPKPLTTRKKISPVEQVLSSLAPSGITWGNTTILKSLKEQEKRYYESSDSLPTYSPSVCTEIKIIPKNKHLFDDSSFYRTPNTDIHNFASHAYYRVTYADLLYNWDSPISLLETLKYNSLPTSDLLERHAISTITHTSSNKASSYATRHFHYEDISDNNFNGNNVIDNFDLDKMDQNSAQKQNKTNYTLRNPKCLDIAGFCLKHETRLEPLQDKKTSVCGATGRCKRCKTNQLQLRCNICLEPASAIFCPCLSCGCVSHLNCLAMYHALGETQCPSGCDCDCTVEAGKGVVESWEVMMGSLPNQTKVINGDVESLKNTTSRKRVFFKKR